MTPHRGSDRDTEAAGYADLLRVRGYPAIFTANALSLWGDFVARVTIAAVVFERTASPLATATTLAVSFVPTFLGRILLGSYVDRFPYRNTLVAAHASRALLVLALLALVLVEPPIAALFAVLCVLEFIGGGATAPNLVLVTDMFEEQRPLYAKAVALASMAGQFNQALGLAFGGVLVALVGARLGLLLDLATFVIAAVVVFVVAPLKPVAGERGRGLRGYLSDLGQAFSDLAKHSVLARFVTLSAVSSLGVVAPEALAIPVAGSQGWGGLLMATPILGAFVGVLLIGRLDVRRQNSLIMPMALAMPVPLLAVALEPPVPVVAVLFLLSGLLQAFMVPLQATFAMAVEPAMRGRMFSLAGAVAVGAAGAFYLLAGWVGQVTTPAAGVAICAVATLLATGLLAVRWPHAHVTRTVAAAYSIDRSSAA